MADFEGLWETTNIQIIHQFNQGWATIIFVYGWLKIGGCVYFLGIKWEQLKITKNTKHLRPTDSIWGRYKMAFRRQTHFNRKISILVNFSIITIFCPWIAKPFQRGIYSIINAYCLNLCLFLFWRKITDIWNHYLLL